MPYSDKRAGVLGCLSLALCAALMFGLVTTCMFPGPYTSALPRPFASDRWQAPDSRKDTRCAMLADLTYRVGVVGRTRSELYHMLGKPDREERDGTSSEWLLCPSFTDIFVLRVGWHDGRAVSADVHDT